jgi:hypothetical protein
VDTSNNLIITIVTKQFFFKHFDSLEIEQYKKFLSLLLTEAVQLPFKKVLLNGKEPLANNCHHNAQEYEEIYSNSECIRGWLVIDGGIESKNIILLSHSAIKEFGSQLYEITPIHSLEPRPFVQSFISEEDFIKLNSILSTSFDGTKLFLNK